MKVREAGVWAHNAGGICSELASVYRKALRKGGKSEEAAAAVVDRLAQMLAKPGADVKAIEAELAKSKIPGIAPKELLQKARARAASRGEFMLGRHGDFPAPRSPNTHSHHGAMSAWMRKNFSGYDPDKAPAIIMPAAKHEKTFGVYNRWRAQMNTKIGGKFEWGNVSEAEMRQLSERMFDAAEVPQKLRSAYWEQFRRMKSALSR